MNDVNLDPKLFQELFNDVDAVWKKNDLYSTDMIAHDQIEEGKMYEFFDTTSGDIYLVSVLMKMDSVVYTHDGLSFDAKHFEIFKIT